MAEDDQGEEGDDRTIELSAIAAIYPELIILPGQDSCNDNKRASLDIQVEPVRPLSIQTPTVADGSAPDEHVVIKSPNYNGHETHTLSHLPHLTVVFSLPPTYPSQQPPAVNLSTEGSWLSKDKVEELENAAPALWEEVGRDQVLYTYIDHVREAAEDAFGIHGTLEVSADLKVALLDFDMKAKRAKFEKETFDCGVCLEPKKGSVCHRLALCAHVFCVDCLQDFYDTCITEGDIGSVKCLAPKCPDEPSMPAMPSEAANKIDRTLEPSELLQIPLKQEIVQRYIKLKRKKQLESDRNTVYCPRQWCQGPARAKVASKQGTTKPATEPPAQVTDSESKPLPAPADRLAICEDCIFAFCLVCKASWHGEYFTCFPRSQFEITAEERASEEYMNLHTQPCPTCDARAQKTHGCNHMICFKCDTHFCYLCGSYLLRENPYEHYNTKNRGCYMRLWELEAGDDGEFGLGFGGGAEGVEYDSGSDSEDDDEPAAAPAPVPVPAPQPVRPLGDDGRPVRPRGLGAGQRHREREGAALRRFLEMVRDDREDEWDSDDMSEEEIDNMGEVGPDVERMGH